MYLSQLQHGTLSESQPHYHDSYLGTVDTGYMRTLAVEFLTPYLWADTNLLFARPIARIDWGCVWDPKEVDLLDPKGGLFEPWAPTKPHFWPILSPSGPLADLGGWGCISPLTPWLPAPGGHSTLFLVDVCHADFKM